MHMAATMEMYLTLGGKFNASCWPCQTKRQAVALERKRGEVGAYQLYIREEETILAVFAEQRPRRQAS